MPLFFTVLIALMPLFVAPTYFSYRGFKHPPCDVGFRFDGILNAAESVVSYKARIDISGQLIANQGNSQTDLSQQIEQLELAYSQHGGDAVLTLNDGSTSPNSILNSETLGGVRVVQAPSFPTTRGAELVTVRNFTAVLEAVIPTLYGSTALWHFSESIDFIGTGKKSREVVDVTQGRPVPQTTRQKTAMMAIQTGEAIGYLARWPGVGPVQNCAAPIWPDLEQEQYRSIHKGSPEKIGSGADAKYIKWPTSWRYTFKSADPIDTTQEPGKWPAQL